MAKSRKIKEKYTAKQQSEPKTFESAAMEIVSFARESVAPIVSERIQKTKPFVFWGSDNLYPNDLVRMSDNSALHSAILDTKSKMIAGNGIIFEKDNSEAEKFLNEATENWGGIKKTIERLAVDLSYFAEIALNVQFNEGGKIGTIKHSDISYLRSGKMDLQTRTVKEWYHSTRWDIATNKRNYSVDDEIYRPVVIPSFDEKRIREKGSRDTGQLIVAKRYSPSVIYYAKPSYIGATNYIHVAAKIANFHKSQLDNGMMGNMHIHLKQDLTNAETRRRVLKEMNEQYAGTNNAGTIILTYGLGDANIPIITPIQSNDAHTQLALLNEKVNQEIVSAHGIPRRLTQLDEKTGLGGAKTMEDVDMYQTLQISPEQKLIEDTFNQILRFNGIKEEIKIDPLKPSTLILSDTLMKLSTTVDEMRDIRKEKPLEDIEKGGKLLTEVESNGKSGDTTNEKR